ncbi:MAG: hypothetical protein EOS32_25740 [Mesorhizobium sp.]|uniref:hypothetical protein n=1 Tax=Mesorhizobium sp. TaxID=1871066 RepID=UPI000FE72AB6|nr:hypothetical protein [Mesorhizobium sp.]RWC92598.1 MAG: hypothetical protein EOS32_25740 [Mesorhizobium sp.]
MTERFHAGDRRVKPLRGSSFPSNAEPLYPVVWRNLRAADGPSGLAQACLGLHFAPPGPIAANAEEDGHYEETLYNGR